MGFYFNFDILYGLPERADEFNLKTTEYDDPYRVYALDVFPHYEWSRQSLYSGLPYLAGHSAQFEIGLLYYNTAESWVDILEA